MNGFTPEVKAIALSMMEELDTPRALTVSLLLRHGELRQLLQLECNPHHYVDVLSYQRDAAATAFLSKIELPDFAEERQASASEKWFASERQCFVTNRRLYELMDFGTLSGTPVHERVLEYFRDVKRLIRAVIGDRPPEDLVPRFGPGATVSDKVGFLTVANKMSSVPSLTDAAVAYLPFLGRTAWGVAIQHRGGALDVVRGNTYFTVPKKALVLRACAKEPSINVSFQLALGRVLRQRLKDRAGIDLQVAQDLHRSLAKTASIYDNLATLDLSSASDTICTALVELCMPPAWYSALSRLRSPFTRVKGKWVRLEKFSSMGNGFTFELETLLFWALLTVACKGQRVYVYGDDLIFPNSFDSDVTAVLEFCGFTVNRKKSFTYGYFRESCGGDYFMGVDVRPHFLEVQPNEPQEWIALANGLKRLENRLGRGSDFYILGRSWFKTLDQLPDSIRRCRGPKELGDICIHDESQRWQVSWRHGIRRIRTYSPITRGVIRWDRFDPFVQFASALYGVEVTTRDGLQYIMGRTSVTSYALRWTSFS